MSALRLALHASKPGSGDHPNEVYGLDVAFDNVARACLRYGKEDQYTVLTANPEAFAHFQTLAQQAGTDPARLRELSVMNPAHYAAFDVIFRPDPLCLDLSWGRAGLARVTGPALCGIAHTMSTMRTAARINQAVTAPCEPGDAIICPSFAIRDAVASLLQQATEYFNHRFQGRFRPALDLPVIPLGVDCAAFTKKAAPDKRAAQRAALGVGPNDILILHLGRLSFATKMYPTAMMQAVERAARGVAADPALKGRAVHYVMMGYFKPPEMEDTYRALLADICVTAQAQFVMNADPRFPDGLWAAADIFLSLSDNVQESFGLVPIEAMASGLPSVISDWNGYRDGVRHGLDGFRVPTLTPPPDAGRLLADATFMQRWNYGEQLAAAALCTAVDVEVAAATLQLLASDDARRQNMGAAARARAQALYDWPVVIQAYEALWQEQAAKRKRWRADPAYRAPLPPGWMQPHPDYANPFVMFAGFPSRQLQAGDRVERIGTPEDIALLLKHSLHRFVPDVLLPDAPLQDLINRLAVPHSVTEILAAFDAAQAAAVLRSLAWLYKLGLVRITPAV